MGTKISSWKPEFWGVDVLPPASGRVEILPITARDGKPTFDDSLLEIPKRARAQQLDVAFAGTDDPQFLTEYGEGVDYLALAVVVSQFASAEAIAALRFVVIEYLRHLGWGSRVAKQPMLSVKVAKVSPDGTVEGLEVSGEQADVLAALERVLSGLE
ncbi:hypothetical protein [Demequina sp. NBRC 110052]|uniref:hypothetical protein n=1 Tax=Demequina sp. NBRC 110052 TaxID=1570341 RepID=UPI0009FC3DE8|nr:hypothetical protein [Demequina sp. NBRC 110052]